VRLSEHLNHYVQLAESFIATHGDGTVTRHDVETGVTAWAIAHKAGITRHAYDLSRDILDAHIQTALEHVFPCAKFKDKKRY